MTWVRLDDQFFRHRKVVAAGRDARELYLAALCYCAGALTDGYVSDRALRRLAADAEVKAPEPLAQRLVAVGLWERADAGYRVHDYLDYNPAAGDVESRRAEDAARKARERANGSAGMAPYVRPESAGTPSGHTPESGRSPEGHARAGVPVPGRTPGERSDDPGPDTAGEARGAAPRVGDGDALEPGAPAGPDAEAAHLWERVSDRLRGAMTAANYRLHIDGCTGVALHDGTLLVRTRTPAQLDEARRFTRNMQQALEDLGAGARQVRLIAGSP